MKDVDTDFTDINKEKNYKSYIIVGILYVIAIILFILLIFGLKNQKNIVGNNFDTKNDIGVIR